jgi:hypothetical protein
VHEFYRGSTNQMPPRRVLSEIATVSTDHITFVDDNFLVNHDRENVIADMIRAEGIKKRFSMECRTDSIVRHPELLEKWVRWPVCQRLGLEKRQDPQGVRKSANIDSDNRRQDSRDRRNHLGRSWSIRTGRR